ncbi:MAG: beta-ketoacyl-[acyl-carrier-protein] synthase family protein [Bacteroidales bacterium]|nr:beta-ketoacyl-[acyl-carrier-protein] synthase family protein [Bacteroidales bacterium]
MSESRVFITGTGIISAVGNNADEVFQALKTETSGIGRISLLETVHCDDLPAGEIKLSNRQLREIAGLPSGIPCSRTGLLGLIAARQALRQAKIDDMDACRTGLISGTTAGGMDRSEVFYRSFMDDHRRGRLRDVVTHDCGESTERIADGLSVRDYVATISTACSSSANSILYGSRLLKSGILDRVIVGGTEALTLFTLNGFNSLLILDRNVCRPFDRDRNGLNLGEGAAFLVLESERIALTVPERILCEVTGYGNACDAYHQTASSPEGHGAWLSMKKALETAKLQPDDIDYINAHGTGTQNNDLSEGIAIERLFESGIPLCSSTKSYTGHTLGAAGATEAVICVLTLANQIVFPNLNFNNRMEELHFSPVTTCRRDMRLNHVMSNSFGFGGNNTTIILSGYSHEDLH